MSTRVNESPPGAHSGQPARRRSLLIGAILAAALLGAGLRGLLPPFVLDDRFWREFWSGPPTAGLFAILAASIAFFPAWRSTHIARENAAREQWWKRAEWALERAGSSDRLDRAVANDALVALLSSATETEGKMILRTITNLQDGLDSQRAIKHNEHRRRSWRR